MVSAPENKSFLPEGFLTTIQVEPVGRWFLSHWERLNSARTISLNGLEESSSESDSESSECEIEFEDDIAYLRSLDPKNCKDQDHYKVLGLASLRIKCTEDQIKKAYRAKVLRHHPDKRRAAGEEIREDDDYFTCITKAFEVLGVPSKRRAYDSVDPTFDDDIPEWTKKSKPEEFYETFGPAFERNAQWSLRKHVPHLGDDDTPRDKVDKFYKFWYNFESWREYSYLDEEDKEKGTDRDERRWIEKNNKVQRAEKKKEEMKRIRKLVDAAYNADPRVARFREQDKAERMAKKKAKQEAAKAKREEEERARKETEDREKAEQARIEAEAKAKADAIKKEKEALKKALKKERKTLRTICKDHDFYSRGLEDVKLLHMTELDRLCEILPLEELEELNKNLEEEYKSGDKSGKAFLDRIESMKKKMQQENMELVEIAANKSSADKPEKVRGPEWSSEELALLIKAVNIFPAGTNQRWEVIASFINQHTPTPEIERKAKETLAKAKELQQGNYQTNVLREDVNKKAYENLEKQKKRDVKMDDVEASKRMDTPAEIQGINPSPWTPDEQKLLEQALKTHPSTLGSERWERIAACIPNRSKKDCMKRYKELAELVRSKKAAQAAAAASTAAGKK